MPIFINTKEDIQWLKDTHLKTFKKKEEIKSALIYGNEDCPDKIKVYSKINPLIADVSVTIRLTEEEL